MQIPPAALRSLGDNREAHEVRRVDPRDDSAVTVDLRYLGRQEDRAAQAWVQRSDQELLRDRLLWVVGNPEAVRSVARERARSQKMIGRYEGRRESLNRERLHLLGAEQAAAPPGRAA